MKDRAFCSAEGALFESYLALPGRRQGKVRDLYELPSDEHGPRVLIVASDRLSAFDVVMPTPVPGKGRLLNELAAWWLHWIERHDLCETHLLSTDAADVPGSAFDLPEDTPATPRAALDGRVTIGRRLEIVPVECVVRGYLEGSGWKDYQRTGAVCGIELPSGLERCAKLPEPIFTPATKAEQGEHDENIGFDAACEAVGRPLMERLREISLAIYHAASEHASARGMILADTKFEFGLPIGRSYGDPGVEPVLADEALTPDSSRFWPSDRYAPGRSQPSFDKQFVREHLEQLVDQGAWNKTPPGPELPGHVVQGTLDRYREAIARLAR
ncbi:MAG: phosphoribosylaminoimidazolesuccinocarboxamide synthase [Planctomycetota bacterium]